MADNVKVKGVNGVDVDQLIQTIGAVKDNPRLGGYTFFGETHWRGGAFSETKIQRYHSVNGAEAQARTDFIIPVDEPRGLLGKNQAANPVEHILAGLASCLVIGISYNAAARGIELEELKVNLQGNINLEGFLGLKEEVRPGYESIKLEYTVRSSASKEDVDALISHVEKTSPVLDIVSNPVPVERSLDLQGLSA